MNPIVKRIAATMACCLPLISCFRESFEAGGVVLRADTESVSVPADGPELVPQRCNVTITSNRSWSAYLEPEVDWVGLSMEEFENIARSEEISRIELTFQNWKDRDQDRSTTLWISTSDGKISVPIVQTRQIPYIRLETPSVVDDIVCQADTSIVRFESNIEWIAQVMSGASANVSIDKTSGSMSGEIEVSFAENDAADIEPEATLVLMDAAGQMAPVTVEFKQARSAPYVKWVTGLAEYRQSQPGSLTLEFKTNTAWTAQVKDAPSGISLSRYSGDKTQKSLDINFDGFYGVGQKRQAVVVLMTEEGATSEMTVSQTANELFLDFSGGNQPFTDTIPSHAKINELVKKFVSDTPTDYILSCNGAQYDFVFYSGEGYGLLDQPDGQSCGIVWQYSTKMGQGAWIKLPAVEGKTLVRVKLYASNMGAGGAKNYIIDDAQPQSTAAPWSGNLGSSAVSKGEYGTVNLKDPKPGVSYYMVAANNSFYFSKLHLYYE